MKATIHSEINRRKELKGKMAQMKKTKWILGETLTKLYINISEISDMLETMKANADDQYKLIQLRTQEYQDIIAGYKKTWDEYRVIYEEFPLAKARRAAEINLEKLKIEHRITSYKKAEIITIIKQRRRIDWIRMRCKIIEFVTVMLERMKFEEKLTKLKGNVKNKKKDLQSIEAELKVLHKKEEDQKRRRKKEMLQMAPPKINIPFREMMHAQNQMRARTSVQHQIQEPFDDTISVNTLYLEELCINENATASSLERMDVDTIHDNDYNELHAVEAELTFNSKSAIVSENDNTRPASVAPELSAEKEILTDNDVEMREIHHDEIQKSQESVKTQLSCRNKESPLKHSAAGNTQDEVQAKRIRLERQDSEQSINKITTRQPSTIKEMGSKSLLRSIPQIKKIESVHYNITPLMPVPKPVQHSTVATSSMFSPMHYEYCDSNMSSIDQDFVSKGAPSFCGDSMCNYKLSPTSNLSISIDEDAQMAPSSRYATQQHNKTESGDKSSEFELSNLLKKAKDDFSLF
ncbi:uncharacterized protein LOC105201658 isoform X2 [Solenopsis invicta]|nr:uncharacterized protein LOC105201658 isoform X2 [Solenopsis invicta]